ncbi:DUF3147 family protein [Alloacidobacterium dinghuense]|uniref:DUF3147 family protein n=1 Tax=Alloacidobacterium dinghuense TaxID=2763107 RepID=A0A7G8BLD1_9BACT|nr:DUF3147 family protein [Alloacidobacterium dinghuense]QNI33351.1 DUF3147 family protein [Alloacidobacterium dinghuense]
MSTLLLRFLIGGFVVSFFATLGDVLRPKSFAGLFGAAPSIALATLGLSIHEHGKPYTAFEARSMLFGAVAFFVYAALTSWVLRRFRPNTLLTTLTLMPFWFAVSIGLWAFIGGSV